MIILRYLSRELLQTTLSVTIVLLVVIMGGRFIKYLAEAAAGKLEVDIVLMVMAYRIPGFLELILPLSFFISILLAYGRLYTDSEMTILYACGISRRRILAYTCAPASVLAMVVALLSLWLSPLALQKANLFLESQKSRSELEMIQPGRFQVMRNSNAVSYAEALSDNNVLEQVFIARTMTADDKLTIVHSATARHAEHKAYGQRYWMLENGVHYQGQPGSADYRVTQFSEYGQYLPRSDILNGQRRGTDVLPTTELLQSSAPAHVATWQWRFSLPLLTLIIMLLGIPLSETNLRRGRHTKLFPAIILYLVYVVLLSAVKGALEKGNLPTSLGLWWVHALFFLLALSLWTGKPSWIKKFGFG